MLIGSTYQQLVENQKIKLQKTVKVPKPARILKSGKTFSVHSVDKSTEQLPSGSPSEEIVFSRVLWQCCSRSPLLIHLCAI